jgi:predicted amidophosphoribosyltransferase
MPTVAELTELYGNFMLGPRPGPDVCDVCFTFTEGHDRCFVCGQQSSALDAVAPISYSIAGGQLHHALAGYKRLGGEVGRRLQVEVAALLWRFLAEHEECVARSAATTSFEIVTTVPSSSGERDEKHPLRRIVGDLVLPTRDRYERLLTRSAVEIPERAFDARRYEVVRPLDGQAVLLVDDTWTTGSGAQSAAAALREAGAGQVAAVVIGRHVKREWRENERRLRAMARPFDWASCAWHRAAHSPQTYKPVAT